MHRMERQYASPSPSTVTIALAASGNKGSKLALRWALDNLCYERRITFEILHIRPKITMFQSPTGSIPISAIRPDVAAAYINEIDTKAFDVLAPYQQMCAQRKVKWEMLVIEADDVVAAISEEVVKSKINKLILGSSFRNVLSRKFIGNGPHTTALGLEPHFCTVYFVSKGKLSSVHTASLKINRGAKVASRRTLLSTTVSPTMLLPHKQTDDHSEVPGSASASDTQTDPALSNVLVTDELMLQMNGELEKLRSELRHVQDMFKMETSQKVVELNTLKVEEDGPNLMGTKEEKAREPTKSEKEKHEGAGKEAAFARDRLERELVEKKVTVALAAHEAKDKHKLESAVALLDQQFEKFDWEEIVSGTSSFADSFRIGEGAYGAVYKCMLRHITVAVKVLKALEVQKDIQFQRELEILSRIRHPHLLLFLGACPDHGCLVYEYMENGSLDDRLHMKNGTAPISWFDRFRIAWEVASALLFLHSSKPRPVVHRDIKPANILLDHNLVSKIGDVGLSTLIPMDRFTKMTAYKKSSLVGTYGYVDPEYQRSGLVSPKSDLYAFGIVILQLLTRQPPIGLADFVERAMEEGRFEEILDDNAGKWPIKETRDLACLGLQCAEVRHKDRPKLIDDVLPVLVRLKEVADNEKSSILKHEPANHFLSPEIKETVESPVAEPAVFVYEI